MPSIAELEAQLEAAKKNAAPPPVIAKGGKGEEIKVGDTVTLTYKVLGVHENAFDEDGETRYGHVLNLGKDSKHQFTVDALDVFKVD